MSRLIECVPNFSEGRRPEVITAIIEAITSVSGAILLDHEMDADHNRAVITFVAPPNAVVEAAFRGYQKASELIDMPTHSGAHPRMGACDVCPFIPLGDVTTDEAIELAHALAKRVGEELKIPVYLYEDAATNTKRKNLASVRAGEYEGIRDSIATDPERIPDYGPRVMNLKSGATAIGVRYPLVAYNVYLGTSDVTIAGRIADAVRHLTGGYRFVKALGFDIKERNQAQISMNLTNYTKTPIHRVFETIKSEAERYGVMVTSSEIVGLLPSEALFSAAEHYLRIEKFSKAQILDEKLRVAISSMPGSSGVPEESLFDQVASASPAPGGGSVAAAAGSLAGALTAMVCRLTIGKKAYADVRDELSSVRDQSDALRKRLEQLVVEDTEAFMKVMSAFKLPKASEPQQQERDAAIQIGYQAAAQTPLETMSVVRDLLRLTAIVARKGNQASLSDAGVAALMGQAAIEGAYYNVSINLGSITDESFRNGLKTKADAIRKEGNALVRDIRSYVDEKLGVGALS